MVAFGHLSEDSRADVVEGLAAQPETLVALRLHRRDAPDRDFDPLREWTRARAAEGVRLEDLLRSFGLAHQLGWQLLRRHARRDESEVLLELAAPLAQYVDQVSAVVTETYLAERELLVSEDERRTRSLLDRLSVDSPLDAADSELADRLGVPRRSRVLSLRRRDARAPAAQPRRARGAPAPRRLEARGDAERLRGRPDLEAARSADLGEGPEVRARDRRADAARRTRRARARR